MAQQARAIDGEPIFWSTTRPGYNDNDRQRFTMVNGRRIVEKFPQHGHVGDYDRPEKAPGTRFWYMNTHQGNEIAMVLTNGASHLDPNSAYGQYVKMKARFLGWFAPGQCPVALLGTGELHPDHIVDKTILHDSKPCPHGEHNRKNPCRHSVAEKKARQKQHAEDEAERLKSYKDNGEKMIEAQREQTAAIVEAITAALAKQQTPEQILAMVQAIAKKGKAE